MNKKMSEKKYKREVETVDYMISYFSNKKHGTLRGELSLSCLELKEYCNTRIDKCPRGEKKPFCSNCKIHCYDKEHRERIKEVMRYAGPRMFFHKPIMAIRHLIESSKERRMVERDGER
jgi:hypothetical protein